MSYILDALRRADSERERGAIPDIHAQAVPLLTDEEPAPRRLSPWVWGGAAAAVIALLAGALVWALNRQEPAASRLAAPGPAPVSPAPAAPVPAFGPAPPLPPQPQSQPLRAEGLPAPAVPPVTAPTGSATRALPPAAPPRAAAPARPAAIAKPPVGAAADGLAAGAVTQPAAPGAGNARRSTSPADGIARAEPGRAAASVPGAAPAAPVRIYAQNELPEEVRRGVPALVVNGSVFSKNPADRFLIINGQIVREKDAVAPDVVLEQIKLRAAVLVTKGFRFEITY